MWPKENAVFAFSVAKSTFIVVATLIFGMGYAHAQEGQQPAFRVELNPDTVLMDNPFEVQFIWNGNANCGEFVPPPFTDFDIAYGPHLATSIQIVNGQMRQQQVWSYGLMPRSEGIFYIGPASVRCQDGQVFETEPIEVWVKPNPDGIRQTPRSYNNPWTDRLDGFHLPTNPFKELDEFFQQLMPPKESPQYDSTPAPKHRPPRKKRKVYRI